LKVFIYITLYYSCFGEECGYHPYARGKCSCLLFNTRILGKKVAINIDGLEWQREKWGKMVSWYLRFSERLAGVMADVVVTDARCIRKYYKQNMGGTRSILPMGATK